MGQRLLKRQFRSRDGFHVVTGIGCDSFRWRSCSRHAIRIRQPWMGTSPSLSSRLSRSRLRRRGVRPATCGCRAAAIHVCAGLRGPTNSGPAARSDGTPCRHSTTATSLYSPLFLRDYGWPARCRLRLQQPRIRCLRRPLNTTNRRLPDREFNVQNHLGVNHHNDATACKPLICSHFTRKCLMHFAAKRGNLLSEKCHCCYIPGSID
jgi:hypothetical protein